MKVVIIPRKPEAVISSGHVRSNLKDVDAVLVVDPNADIEAVLQTIIDYFTGRDVETETA